MTETPSSIHPALSLERGPFPLLPQAGRHEAALRLAACLEPDLQAIAKSQPLLLLSFADKVTAQLFDKDAVVTLTPEYIQDAVRLDLGLLNLNLWPEKHQAPVLVSYARPFHTRDHLASLLVPNRRTLIVPACGLYKGQWYDAPIVHLAAEGQVVSYLPAGGPSRLIIPTQPATPASSQTGLTLDEAQKLEGEEGSRMQRCLVHACMALFAQEASPEICVQNTDWSLRQAVSLVLARQAAGSRPVILTNPQATPHWPSAWRRLCQNAGIVMTSDHRADKVWPLSEIDALLPLEAAPLLIAAINRLSDVIPPSLGQESTGVAVD